MLSDHIPDNSSFLVSYLPSWADSLSCNAYVFWLSQSCVFIKCWCDHWRQKNGKIYWIKGVSGIGYEFNCFGALMDISVLIECDAWYVALQRCLAFFFSCLSCRALPRICICLIALALVCSNLLFKQMLKHVKSFRGNHEIRPYAVWQIDYEVRR